MESRQTVFDTNDCSSSKKEKKERNRKPRHFLKEFSCQMKRSDDEREIMSKTETIVIFFSHNCKKRKRQDMTIHLKRKTLFVDQPISETTPKSVRTHTRTHKTKIHTSKKMLDETENT